MVRHSSPSIDLIYFLYSSVKTEVLQKHWDEIIDTYEKCFISEMHRLKAPKKDIDARNKPGWFNEEVRLCGKLGFFGALMVIHAIFMDEKLASELGTVPDWYNYYFPDYYYYNYDF